MLGRAIVRLARADGHEIACAIGSADVGRDAGELAGIGAIGTCVVDGLAALEHARADVVVDFSAPAATRALAPIAAAAGSAIVSGTTGLDPSAREALDHAARRVAVLWEPNTSIGVHVLSQLVAQAASALGDWDVESRGDAPSGQGRRAERYGVAPRRSRTARPLPALLASCTADTERTACVRRTRWASTRCAGETSVGDHIVYLAGGGERLELVHRATSRDVFAHGALRAAKWIAGQSPGRYSLGDVVATPPA